MAADLWGTLGTWVANLAMRECVTELITQLITAWAVLIELDSSTQPPAHCKRSVVQQQQRLHKLCCERRDGTRSVKDTLRALGHCVQLQWLFTYEHL